MHLFVCKSNTCLDENVYAAAITCGNGFSLNSSEPPASHHSITPSCPITVLSSVRILSLASLLEFYNDSSMLCARNSWKMRNSLLILHCNELPEVPSYKPCPRTLLLSLWLLSRWLHDASHLFFGLVLFKHILLHLHDVIS